MVTENDAGTEASTSRKGGIILTLLILGFFTLCLGITLPLHVLFLLLTGWASQAVRLVDRTGFTVPGIIPSLMLILAFAMLLHFALRVLFRRRAVQTEEASEADRWQRRWTFSFFLMLVVLLLSGVCVIGMAQLSWQMIAVDQSLNYHRDGPALRSTTKNNLKQIGLAFHNYSDTNHVLPSGGFFNRAGEPQHGWVAQLLPYLEQQALYETIEFNQPWTADINREPYQTTIPFLLNPGFRRQDNPIDYQPADYAANSHLFNVNTSMKLDEIKDGTSYTILAGEVSTGIKAWGDPTNFRDPQLGINASPNGFGSPYLGGAHFLLADGSVRFISEKIDPRTLRALATPSGNETVGEY
ncbi:DUF1559 domain-containing protein [Gimesia sp.]|uniref:DUF1559 family PulG-like putative transporter n=1 Tax=Gimesia sp. TaxID=2024833 RepID=UPI003A8E08C6